jgi:uncharacterized protein YdcH (DUF465 family)
MYYKGYYIDDEIFVDREETVELNDVGHVTLDKDRLSSLLNKLKEYEEISTQNGIGIKDIHYEIHAQDYQYNPNGPDREAESSIVLCWKEKVPETDEKRNERITKEKNRIDALIKEKEAKQRNAELSKLVREQNRLDEAIRIVEENGGTVKFKHKKRNEEFSKNC